MEPEVRIPIPLGVTLLRRDTETDEAALTAAYDRYASGLYRYALALTSSADDAEDAVQEVFLALARRPGQLGRVDDPRAYLVTATRNAAYTLLRGRRRRAELEEAVADTLPLEEAADIGANAAQAAVLREAFARLPLEQREVLALKVFEEMTFQEIARAVGASPNTVASRYRYAIEKLRRALQGEM